MAAHNATAAAQNSVAERRLRPIYDWLDNGNNKKALQEAEKVLKKQPNFQCCKILKSLALLRLGRENEAQPILDSVLSEGPTDDGTLQAMTIAFRELQQPEKICTMYENATSREQNEELLSHLFMSYVRMGFYKKQQQAAMLLYKVKPKNPYYFWAVMSIVLQATTGGVDEKLAMNMLLPLAEKMIAKMAKEKKMEQEQETHLYLMVLELQKKFSDALEVLNGPIGQQLQNKTSYWELFNTKKIDYLKKLEKWSLVNSLAKEMLVQTPDQWNIYLDYITSVFHIIDQKGVKLEDKIVDTGLEDAVNFITLQQDKNSKCRGPFLAQMELQSRLIARRDPKADTQQMVSLMISYFQKFGSKQCAAMDLKLFLPSLDDQDTSVFFQEIHKQIKFDEKMIPTDIDNMQRDVNWHQLHRFSGNHHPPLADAEQRYQIAIDLFQAYENCLPLVKDFKETDVCPNDAYMMLGGQILWDLWMETHDDLYFWKSVVHLSYALKKSGANYQLRFLLIKFFNHVGAVGPSQVIHLGLELKHIQLDSLGYLMSHHIMSCGHLNETAKFFRNTLRFFSGNYKDTIDYIISAYRCGSFDKIREFIKLRDRLTASQHFASISIEQKLLDLFTETQLHGQTVQMMSCLEIEPDKDTPEWSMLTDNRDFKAVPSWDPVDRAVNDELISESFLQEQKFLKYRSFVMRALATAVYISEDIHPSRLAASNILTTNEKIKSTTTSSSNDISTRKLSDSERASLLYPVMETLIEGLTKHHEETKKDSANLAASCKLAFGPDAPRLALYINSSHIDLLINLLIFTLNVYKLVTTKEPMEQEKIKQILETISKNSTSQFKDIVSSLKEFVNTHVSQLYQRYEKLESLINATETASFAAILCGVCQVLLKSGYKFLSQSEPNNSANDNSSAGKQSSIKGSKKKGNKNAAISNNDFRKDLQPYYFVFNELVENFSISISSLLSIVEDFEKVVGEDKLNVLQSKFSSVNLESRNNGKIQQTFEKNNLENNDSQEVSKSETNDSIKSGYETLDSVQSEIVKQMESSFGVSFLQIKTVIQNKQNYFSYLKCDTGPTSQVKK